MKACGEFEVSLTPQEALLESAQEITFGRFSIAKQFKGELHASSQVDMLSVRTTHPESAGYVALEHVTGNLAGRQGSFVLQHFGTLNRGQDRLLLEVVPDSGVEQLAGLSGSMVIKITNGQHFYEFDYGFTEA